MAIKLENVSKLDLDALVEMYRHYLILVDKSRISGIKFTDEHMEIYCESGLMSKFQYGRSYVGNGHVVSFDRINGEGVIKTKNGDCVSFFSSSFVGADSKFPHLVSNIDVKHGERVKFKLSGCNMTVLTVGAVEIRKAA